MKDCWERRAQKGEEHLTRHKTCSPSLLNFQNGARRQAHPSTQRTQRTHRPSLLNFLSKQKIAHHHTLHFTSLHFI